ncbi:MAG: phosphatidate cytidylyltransferase [Chitinophagaceae bacterium]|nr:MAG: phosphatidate cytidylyltransferase [Chitinophagaceae bacterium]
MALNWQTFKTRALTAIVFVVVMLAGLLWNQWSFLVLFSIIHFGCWWEYFRLLEKMNNNIFHVYTKLGLMLMGYAILLWFCGSHYQISGYGLRDNFSLPVSLAGFIMLITGIFQKNTIGLKFFANAALGLLYISLSWGFMLDLYFVTRLNHGDLAFNLAPGNLPIIIIASIWINDTMAYIVGSFIGKTPLSKISPKKTWEGTIGGVILCITVIGALTPLVLYREFLIIHSIAFGIIAGISAIVGTLGDLLESKLKRKAGVKDSGQIMPGHGGFLDRFDSLLLATPLVWLYVQLFMR